MFPIDPRDFARPHAQPGGDSITCDADSLDVTDAPSNGALYRWSLGDPFFKSNLVVFYYGNLTHPSVDPPRMGFLSRVPDNAAQLLAQSIADAQGNGGNFGSTTDAAPSDASATTPAPSIVVPTTTTSIGVGSSTTTTASGRPSSNSASGFKCSRIAFVSTLMFWVLAL